MATYQIKQMSDMTSVTVRTLQYYDEIGLVKPSHRSAAGYRLYSDDDILVLHKITTLKFFGFTLQQIKQFSQ